MFNDDFYPTPKSLINKMWFKVKDRSEINSILEPSAGKGDIIDYINGDHSYRFSCIEIDPELQHILTGKGYKLIDSNFLNYSGLDKFDLIIGNPPFSAGAEHLLKAIEIMYSGQIVFLLNAETIKNPYSAIRKTLAQKLSELNAEIEYIQDSFVDAERKTKVEIAIVHIEKKRNIDFDLFDDCDDAAKKKEFTIDESSEIAHRNTVEFMVEEFNATVTEGIETILYYFKHSRIRGFLRLSAAGNDSPRYCREQSLTKEVNETINSFLENVRECYWKKVLDIDEVRKRMTENKKKEFYDALQKQSNMDFTENNIRSFIIKLIGNYENILTEAVAEIFDRFTQKYHWHEESEQNIHYYNGWKTNQAFYVNSKVILPFYNGFIDSWNGAWKVDYSIKDKLNDIDIVMNYFSSDSKYVTIVEALENAFKDGESKKIKSTYFTISVFKKGTIHLIFNDENIRRRFNIIACKHKNWLPQDYGSKKFSSMNKEEQAVAESFEGKESYSKNINQIGFAKKNVKFLS